MKYVVMFVFFIIGAMLASTDASYTVTGPLNVEVSQQEYIDKYEVRRVEIERLNDTEDKYATYAYHRCLEFNPQRKQGVNYSCVDMIKTFTAENMQWDMEAINRDTNGTFDKGLCQLNSRYHLPFIKSTGFLHPMTHIEYCVSVWIDAYKKGRMPFYGYWVRHTRTQNAGNVYLRW